MVVTGDKEPSCKGYVFECITNQTTINPHEILLSAWRRILEQQEEKKGLI